MNPREMPKAERDELYVKLKKKAWQTYERLRAECGPNRGLHHERCEDLRDLTVAVAISLLNAREAGERGDESLGEQALEEVAAILQMAYVVGRLDDRRMQAEELTKGG